MVPMSEVAHDRRLLRGAQSRRTIVRHAVDGASLDGLDGLSFGRLPPPPRRTTGGTSPLSTPTLWLSRSTQFSPPRTPRSGSATTAPWTRPVASSTDSSHHQVAPPPRRKDGGRAVGHATRQGHSLAMRAHA